MAQKQHPIFARVSLPHGHFTVPRVAAERAGWRELKQAAVGSDGMPLPPKPRVPKANAPKPRAEPRRGGTTPDPVAPASDQND